MVRDLDSGLRQLARVIERDLKLAVRSLPGGGAAGGLGAGLHAFLGGRLRPGVEIVADLLKIEEKLKDCDWIITGEGRLDWQTAHGKAPCGVARVAARLGVPVIAICGSLGRGSRQAALGIGACFSALKEPLCEADLRRRGPGMLADCAEQAARLIRLRLPA
jgi:glycerate kinase